MSRLDQIPSLPPRSDYDPDSSVSSGQKRKRDGSPARSNVFLQSAKSLVARHSNIDRCWNCHAAHTEFCHVIAKADPAYPGMIKKSMVTFESLGDYRNAIVLCGSCHNWFDRSSNTGWIFLPVEQGLEWVVDWERRDFAQREEMLAQHGKETERTYPDEEDYERYCREVNLITEPNDGLVRGGLYHTYILEEMFPPMMMEALETKGLEVPGKMPRGPQRWHGAIMAAIDRGFVVLGAPEIRLPEREVELLQLLQRLYSRRLPSTKRLRATENLGQVDSDALPSGSACSRGPMQHSGDIGTNSRDPNVKTRKPDCQNDIQDAPSFDSAVDVLSVSGRSRKRRRRPPQDDEAWDLGVDPDTWCFGPMSTTEQKMTAYVGKVPLI